MLPQWVDRSGGKQLYVPSVPCMSQQSTHRVSMSVRFTSAWPSTPTWRVRAQHARSPAQLCMAQHTQNTAYGWSVVCMAANLPRGKK
jgi:hypothetical protein